MLQFIMEKAHDEHLEELFKNISCYSLSISSIPDMIRGILFKNISCYSLSDYSAHVKINKEEFKNISCYSLSLVFMPFFLSYLIFSLILSHFHFFYQVFFTSATLS